MKVLVQVLAFVILLTFMLIGIFASMGVCAMIFGSDILDTVLGGEPDRTHPAFLTFILIMIPGMLVGWCGALFGIILPLYMHFDIPLGRGNELLNRWIFRYAMKLAKYTKTAEQAAASDR